MKRPSTGQNVAIAEIVVYEGLNIYSRNPTIRMSLQCEAQDPTLVRSVEEVIFSLIAKATMRAGSDVPDNASPTPAESSDSEPSSSIVRLAARVALRLQRLLGHDVDYETGDQDGNILAFQYRDIRIGVLAGRTAVELINNVLGAQGEPAKSVTLDSQQKRIDQFIELASSLDVRRNDHPIIRAAETRGIPWFRLFPNQKVIQLGQGNKLQRFHWTYTSHTSFIGTRIATDKKMTSELFRAHSIPAPANIVVTTEEQAVAAANRLGFPVVVKPRATDMGTAVSTGLADEEGVRRAYRLACRHGPVLVEEHIPGDHYRVTVVHGRALSVARQRPAHVVGDGRLTIAELVEVENEGRTSELSGRMKKIKLDDDTAQVLKGQGYEISHVPPEGTEVFLRTQSNLSQGGTMVDVTSKSHPENLAMAERATRLVGLDVAGVDFISTDVSKPFYLTGGAICEVNPTPAMVQFGPDAEKAFLDEYFPPGDDGRIPIAVIAGSAGTTMTAKALSVILSHAGYVTGIATKEEALIDGVRIGVGDFSNIKGCKAILRDPSVGAAVLETTYANIMKQGFGFDHCSVSAVIVSTDEPDQGTSVEDVVRSKELTVAAASDLAVISADDPHFEEMILRAGGTPVCVVSLDPKHPNAIRHIEEGGMAILLEDRNGQPEITRREAGRSQNLISAGIIPAVRTGGGEDAIASACFACGLATGLGVELEAISEGLSRRWD